MKSIVCRTLLNSLCSFALDFVKLLVVAMSEESCDGEQAQITCGAR
jgi:hypothetical protein